MKLFHGLVIVLILFVSGCFYSVTEIRSVAVLDKPSQKFSKAKASTKSTFLPLDLGKMKLIIYVSNYTTEERASKVLWFTVRKDPNPINSGKKPFVFYIGIKVNSNSVDARLGEIKLIYEKNGITKKILPEKVFFTGQFNACGLDYDGRSWGKKSKDVTGDKVSISNYNHDRYSCFNILFNMPTLDPYESFSLDIGHALGFKKETIIYFEPTKVHYIATH